MSDNARYSLGQLSGPVCLFGGPYSNAHALEALQQALSVHAIPPSNIICTGDMVAYCGQPVETLDQIKAWGIPVVMGNCEESLAQAADDCGCGFDEGSSCSLLSVSWYRFSNQLISDEHRSWMASLPRFIDFSLNGLRFGVTHGSPERINEFVFESSSEQRKISLMRDLEVDVMVGGHCGLPFGQALGAWRYWLNSGTIGMPANDASSRVWYLILKPEEDGVSARWHSLDYDIWGAQDAMLKAGLPDAYRLALADGLWPSMDVLPEPERLACGHALHPESLLLRAERSPNVV